MTQSPPRELTGSPTYGREPETPEIGEALDVLELTTAPAIASGSPTTALFGALRVGSLHAEMYGGRVAGAVAILAVDSETGSLYQAVPERQDSSPVQPVIRTAEELASMDAVTSAIESCFSVDLAEHLGLPPEEGRFLVALWLDDLCSEIVSCDVPENTGRDRLQVEPDMDAAGMAFQSDGDPPTPAAGGICLIVSQEGSELKDVCVDARLDLASLPQGDDFVTLVGMLRGHLDREITWCTWRVSSEYLRSTGGVVRMRPLGPKQTALQPQKWFAGLIVGEAMGVIMAHDPSA